MLIFLVFRLDTITVQLSSSLLMIFFITHHCSFPFLAIYSPSFLFFYQVFIKSFNFYRIFFYFSFQNRNIFFQLALLFFFFKFDLFHSSHIILLVSLQFLIFFSQSFVFQFEKLHFISILIQNILILFFTFDQFCGIQIVQSQMIFLFASFSNFPRVCKVRNFNSWLVSFANFLLKGQSILFMMLIEINTNLGQGLFRVFQTKTRLDSVIAVSFLTVPLNTVLD